MVNLPIRVSVPATTANLGPGFDCLGLALDVWNQASFSFQGENDQVVVSGFGDGVLPEDETNLILSSALRVYDEMGLPRPKGWQIECQNRIPIGSGLGSSAAATLIGLLGANESLGKPLSVSKLLALAMEIEGHPDNVAPAFWGGLSIVATRNGDVIARKVSVPPLSVVVVVPDFKLPTQHARKVLPGQISLSNAVFNISRATLVVEALRGGDLVLLGEVMEDRLHQPYRLALIPGAEEASRAALRAGAAAVALSGAGPGVLAFVRDHKVSKQISVAMSEAFTAKGLKSWQFETVISLTGAKVEQIQ
jgi:homoserine kinase